MVSKAKFIVPAAGYGRRVGSPPAKELLLDSRGRPLIENTLDHVRQTGIPAHIVTRSEKKHLIEYLEQHPLMKENRLSLQIIDATEEWPATVLASSPYWEEHNLLLLPDTCFERQQVLGEMLKSPSSVQAAVFPVEDFQNWGVVQNISASSFEIADKPWRRENLLPDHQAWGVLGFRKEIGCLLFDSILQSNRQSRNREIHPAAPCFFTLEAKLEVFKLERFQDLSRGLVVENATGAAISPQSLDNSVAILNSAE